VRQSLGIGCRGGSYTGLFYVAVLTATGPVADDELHVDLEDADFILVVPLEGANHLRLVGTVHDVPGREQGTLTFDDVRGRAFEHLRLTVEKVHWFSTYRVHHRVADRFRDGRVFLLGDAAHVHSPVGGQGMNTGIGDAINLAWKLAAVLARGAPPALLDSYVPERIAFARRLVATTDRGFTVVTARGRLAQFVRTRVAPRLVPLLLRIPPFRRMLFRTVSQILVAYHHSSLSAGTAGSVRGGDRLPWVPMGAGQGEDNFAPLASLDWQVHVYGEAPAALAEACERLRLALCTFAWRPDMRHAGLARNASYLVRPDGYVALADPEANAERLLAYFAERGGLGRSGGSPSLPSAPAGVATRHAP
jgi:hypothetical protein